MGHHANPVIHVYAVAQQNSCGGECDALWCYTGGAGWNEHTGIMPDTLAVRGVPMLENKVGALNIAWHDMWTRDLQ